MHLKTHIFQEYWKIPSNKILNTVQLSHIKSSVMGHTRGGGKSGSNLFFTEDVNIQDFLKSSLFLSLNG